MNSINSTRVRTTARAFLVTLSLMLVTGLVSAAEIVNLNKADAAAFQQNLIGIGPIKAEAIVSYRSKNGKYASIDDLQNVKGLGPALIKKNKRYLSLSKGVTQGDAKAYSTAKKQAGSSKASSSAKTKKKSTSKTAKSDSKKSSSSVTAKTTKTDKKKSTSSSTAKAAKSDKKKKASSKTSKSTKSTSKKASKKKSKPAKKSKKKKPCKKKDGTKCKPAA